MKVYYHNDLDGECSAAILNKYFIENGINYVSSSFIPMTYDVEVDIDKIKKNEKIYVVDFSFKNEVWEEIIKKTVNITWIYHHITSIKESEKNDIVKNFSGIRKDGVAACELTWNFLYTLSMPKVVALIGDYDVWNFKLQDTMEAYYGLLSRNTNPQNGDWGYLFDDHYMIINVIYDGVAILEYVTKQNEKLMENSYRIKFEGHDAIICNTPLKSSTIFDSVKNKKLMIVYAYNGNIWTISLYSKSIDCSIIAQKYGGGGHKGASGFTCKSLPKEFFNE